MGYPLEMQIADLEQKKQDIIADHVRRYHDTNLSEAERLVISQLDYEIKRKKEASTDCAWK